MDIASKFGEKLADLMYEKGITPETLSDALPIALSIVYRYLRKEILPSTTTAVRLADYFKCPLDYLFGLRDEYAPSEFSKPKPFSQRFKKILDEKGLTRYRLKKETKLAKQSVDDWYHGVRNPTVDNIIVLARYFDCPIDYLIGRE